jgi:hypothetical protein
VLTTERPLEEMIILFVSLVILIVAQLYESREVMRFSYDVEWVDCALRGGPESVNSVV